MHAQNWQWKTFTSMNSIRAITSTDSLLWAATEGGMVSYNLNQNSVEKWTNTEGLAENNATAITKEQNTAVWIGFNNGAIQRYDLSTQSFLTINEYEGRQVNKIQIYGDSLLVGLDIGMSIYSISKQEVKETYKRLGSGFQVELPVNDFVIFEKKIWVATEEGIAIGELGNKNLLDPANWQNLTKNNGLPSNNISSLQLYENTLFAGTNIGIAEYSDGHWILHLEEEIIDLDNDKNHLYALTSTFIYQYDTNAWKTHSNSNNGTTFCFNSTTPILGSEENLYLFNSQEQWHEIDLNCMSSNRVSTMTVDQNGVLYVGSGSSKSGGKGYSVYANGKWVNYDRDDIELIDNNDFLESTVDQHNNVWLGTWGDGVLVIKNDSTMIHYDETDGILSTSDPNDSHYPAVTSITEDLNGVMWITIWDSQSNQQLVAIDSNQVTHFGAYDQLYANDLISITVDIWNRKWIGSESNGIYVLDDNYTPHDKSDDTLARLTDSDGLESENIATLIADVDGGVYMGTPLGLQYFLNDLSDIQWGLFSNNIKALAIDGVGNIWAGTQGGISYYYDGAWFNYSIDNSLLIENEVLSLAVDKQNGYVYIGTTQGISRITTHFIEPEENIIELTIYPNPFIPAQHEIVQVDGLIANVSLTIFTPSGHLIKKISAIDEINGRRLTWDGTDETGNPAPGGVYLAVMSNEDGKKQLGKIALIR